MKVSADLLRRAAVRQRDLLAEKVAALREREARDLAAAMADKTAVSGSAWKERHWLENRHRATADMVEALDAILGPEPKTLFPS